MRTNRVTGRIALLALLAGTACSWVSLTEGGQGVRVVTRSQVEACDKIGSVNAETTDSVLFARSEQKVREEIRTLARNEAAELGGNRIVPSGAIQDGRQSFDVYRCR